MTKGVEDGMGAKQRVLAVYPDATIARDHHSAYYAFTKKGAGGRISEYVGSEELVWRSAASKLPAAVPVAIPSAPSESATTGYCMPRDREPVWLLMFDDADRGYATYKSEAEGRDAFVRASDSWNCTLFSPTAKAESPTFAYSLAMYLTRNGQQGNAPELQAGVEQFMRDKGSVEPATTEVRGKASPEMEQLIPKEGCPGCQWVNRNHRRDCPVRAHRRKGVGG